MSRREARIAAAAQANRSPILGARPSFDYVVRAAFGEEWGRYGYAELAQRVADRCNADPFLRSSRPYAVHAQVQS